MTESEIEMVDFGIGNFNNIGIPIDFGNLLSRPAILTQFEHDEDEYQKNLASELLTQETDLSSLPQQANNNLEIPEPESKKQRLE